MTFIGAMFYGKPLTELLSRVAKHLTGRDVEIRLEVPPTERVANGAMLVSLSGRPVIYISPGFEQDELFRVFTHELAHVAKHAPIMQRVDLTDPAKLYSAPSKHVSPAVAKREDEAEILATKWRKYAFLNFMDYQTYDKTILQAKLESLLGYMEKR